MTDTPLPKPESEELFALLGPSNLRLMYGWLYRRRINAPTHAELQLFVVDALGELSDSVDQRLAELRRYFEVAERSIGGDDARFVLDGWSKQGLGAQGLTISSRLEAEVLAPQRCAQCGRTPLEDQVRLHIDYKVPQSWGGGNERENLQPLCERCIEGKSDYFQSQDAHAEQIRQAINYAEPQKRIGELLKAFGGGWVRTDLLSIVASAQEYQEDWQRRLRDLRFLDWEIPFQRRYNEGARVWTYYRVKAWSPWPPDIKAAIKAEEARRKANRSN